MFLRKIHAAALVLAGLAVAAPSYAQTATIYGALSNFDVVNNTGEHGHGFEVEIEGIQVEDIYYAFTGQRYGSPRISATATGVLVRWESPYDPLSASFPLATAPHQAGQAFAGTCYQWYPQTYDQAGCEHFGVSLNYTTNPTPGKTTYRWLVADPFTPGALKGVGILPVAAPVYSVQPPARVGDAPVLVMDVDAPEPAEGPELYGDAQWMKVFVTQLPREVTLDELVSDNAIVPQNAAQVETEWAIVQAEPASNSNGNRRRHRNQGNLDPTTRSVVRRIELYAFTGGYDPITHEALCADLTCTAPAIDEVGELISAQMTAANVQADTLTIAKTGSGDVDSSDRRLACGSKCVSAYDAGTVVTLTASANSGSIFSGWNGTCVAAGTSPTCAVTVRGSLTAQALFVSDPAKLSGGGGTGGGGTGGGGTTTTNASLQVKINGKGAVVSTPSGAISCGSRCSASVATNTSVTLSASPDAGFIFVNWTGACTGTEPACTVRVSGQTQVQANFKK